MSRVQNSYAVTEGAESAPGEPNQLIRRVFPAPVQRQHSPFQRDRERIVQARAFRRLAGKTQVFTSRASDHFRSRLTHTIEVVQIARYVATRLGLNEDLAEALALVHDIGHPPFGHAGERALDRCLQQHGLRFDHNLHALRIVDHFEQRYAEHRGLNLTLAVREGIVKHSRDYPAETHPELVEFLPGQRPPLEAQIIDLADEIAYLTGDLDDGVESGHLDADDLSANVDILKLSFAKVAAEHPGIEGKFLFQEALHAMQNRLTADLIANIGKALSEHSLDTLEAVRVFPERIAVFSPEIEAERRQEKQYLYDHLYTCPALTLEHDKAEEVVTALFAFYMDEPQELPEGYLDELAADGLPRIVADYVAGMTDAYILLQYAQVKRRIPLRKR